MMSDIIIYAPNVHFGGGYELLKDILKKLPEDRQVTCFLDSRIRSKVDYVNKNIELYWVRPTLIGRFSSEIKLCKLASNATDILIFNGIPPFIPNAGRLIVFIQNRLLISDIDKLGFPLKIILRLKIERLALYLNRHRVAQFFVQTQTMKSLLRTWLKRIGRAKIEDCIVICPFQNEMDVPNSSNRENNVKKFDFCYISDGLPHKNHLKLIQAFVQLAKDGLYPSLALTLGHKDAVLLTKLMTIAKQNNLKINNLGTLSSTEVVSLYLRSKALVFPSKLESFGLPLIEATRMGLPIVSSERDYVRDVCVPVETFDPESSLSIARALRRFLHQSEVPQPIKTTKHFLNIALPSYKQQDTMTKIQRRKSLIQ